MNAQLMQALQTAVEAVETKKAALGKAQATLQAAISKAQGAVTDANQEYLAAVDAAQDLRQQLEAELNASLPSTDSTARVR